MSHHPDCPWGIENPDDPRCYTIEGTEPPVTPCQILRAAEARLLGELATQLEDLRAKVAFGKKPGFRQGFIRCWVLAKDLVAPRSQGPSSPE